MFDEILACLDGSPLAEKILPWAREIAAAERSRLTLLRVVVDADELAAQEDYMREQGRLFGAQIKFSLSRDPADAVMTELKSNPRAIAAMTTHGRSEWAEAILGSVALKLIRDAGRPVILYRPIPRDRPEKITSLVIALDGSEFSEKIIPTAVDMAKSINGKLVLVQVISRDILNSAVPGPPAEETLVASYLEEKAREIERHYGIEPHWNVLYGKPGDALSRYVNAMPDAMLAMTTHTRGGLKRAMLGDVAGECIRSATVPILIYWPHR